MRLSIPTHDGGPSDPDDILLGEPPQSIGALFSCASELTRAGRRRSPTLRGMGLLRGRITLSFIVAMVGALLSIVILGDSWGVAVGAVLGMLSVQPFFRRPAATTTFVGMEGLARYTQTKTAPTVEVLRWDDADVLLTWEMRRSTRFIYRRTLFRHTWLGPGRRKLFEIHGVYHDGDGRRPPPQPYNVVHFAKAAERLFTDHLLVRARQTLARGAEIAFEISGAEGLWLGAGRLILQSHPVNRVEVPNDALTDVEQRGGILIIRFRKPEKTLLGRSTEEHRFRVGEIPNFLLLMTLLEERVSVRRDT